MGPDHNDIDDAATGDIDPAAGIYSPVFSPLDTPIYSLEFQSPPETEPDGPRDGLQTNGPCGADDAFGGKQLDGTFEPRQLAVIRRFQALNRGHYFREWIEEGRQFVPGMVLTRYGRGKSVQVALPFDQRHDGPAGRAWGVAAHYLGELFKGPVELVMWTLEETVVYYSRHYGPADSPLPPLEWTREVYERILDGWFDRVLMDYFARVKDSELLSPGLFVEHMDEAELRLSLIYDTDVPRQERLLKMSGLPDIFNRRVVITPLSRNETIARYYELYPQDTPTTPPWEEDEAAALLHCHETLWPVP